MAVSFRSGLRFLVLACVVIALGFLVRIAFQRGSEGVHTQLPKEFDTWVMRKLDYTGYAGTSQLVRITADEARLDRTRFGIFRLGFAHTLLVSNARVGVMIDPSLRSRDPGRNLESDRRQAMGGNGSRTRWKSVTELRVEGIVLKLENSVGAWIEISADHCRGNWHGGGVIAFRGHVRVRGEELDRTVPALDYDMGRRRFVLGRPARGRESSAQHGSEPAFLEEVNATIREIGDVDWDALQAELPFARLT